MPIICPDCKSEIALNAYDAHIATIHPERIEAHALMTCTTTEKECKTLYRLHPEAMQSNGRLIRLAAELIFPYTKTLKVKIEEIP